MSAALELGHFRELNRGTGEASTYEVSIREAGKMPVRVVARLNFGYGSKNLDDDKAFAKRVVDALNAHDQMISALQRVGCMDAGGCGKNEPDGLCFVCAALIAAEGQS